MKVERGFCRTCNRVFALRVPAGGDGSWVLPMSHKNNGSRCPGSGLRCVRFLLAHAEVAAKRPRKLGQMTSIPCVAIQFVEGGNTLWVHGLGGTVLRIKLILGMISSKRCKTSPVPHADIVTSGDVQFCIPSKRRKKSG